MATTTMRSDVDEADEPFLVGDLVLLSTQDIDPFIQPPRFVGPYQIEECLSADGFRVGIPSSMGLKGVFASGSLIRFSRGKRPSRETTPSSGVVDSTCAAGVGGGDPVPVKSSTKKRNRKKKKKLLIIGEDGAGEDVGGEAGEAGIIEEEQQQQQDVCMENTHTQRTSMDTVKVVDMSGATTASGMEISNGLRGCQQQDDEEWNDADAATEQQPEKRRLKRLRKVAETANGDRSRHDEIKQEGGEGNRASNENEAERNYEMHREREQDCEREEEQRIRASDRGKAKVKAEEEEESEDGTVMVDGELEYEVEKILEERVVMPENGRRRIHEYLVKWKGYSVEESTWEPRANLTHAAKLLRQFKRSTTAPVHG